MLRFRFGARDRAARRGESRPQPVASPISMTVPAASDTAKPAARDARGE
jgi:hypothetical protein